MPCRQLQKRNSQPTETCQLDPMVLLLVQMPMPIHTGLELVFPPMAAGNALVFQKFSHPVRQALPRHESWERRGAACPIG